MHSHGSPAETVSRIEFFMWPSYMRNITISLQCLKQLDAVYGRKTPVRIGGTTHDRATYDPDFDGYVSYQVDDPLDAPMKLLYGPRYFDLISEHPLFSLRRILCDTNHQLPGR